MGEYSLQTNLPLAFFSADDSTDPYEITDPEEFTDLMGFLRDPEKFSQVPEKFGWVNDQPTTVNIPTFGKNDLVLPEHLQFILEDGPASGPIIEGNGGYVIEVEGETFPAPTTLQPRPSIPTSQPGAWFDPHNGTLLPAGQDLHFEDGYALNPGFIPEALAVSDDFSGEASSTLSVVDGQVLDASEYIGEPVDSFAIFDAEVVEIDEAQVYALAEEAAETIELTVDSFVEEINEIWRSLEDGIELTPEQIQTLNEAFLVRDQTAEVISRLDSEGFDTNGLTQRLIEPLDTALENAGVSHMTPFEIEQAESGLEVNGEFSFLENGGSVERGFKVAGKVMLVVGLAESGYHIITADKPVEAALQEAGGWAGAFAAASAAESFAAPLVVAAGPFGWAVGGVIGLAAGAAGYWAGSEAGEATYYHFAGEDGENVADNALEIALLELASVENIDARATFLGHGTGSAS